MMRVVMVVMVVAMVVMVMEVKMVMVEILMRTTTTALIGCMIRGKKV